MSLDGALTRSLATGSLVILAALATLVVMSLAQGLLAPILLGLVFGVVLAPFVYKLERLKVPRAVSASLAVLLALLLTGLALSAIGPVITELLRLIPDLQRELEFYMRELSRMLRGLETLGGQVEEALTEGGEAAMDNAVPSLMDALWLAPNVMAQLLIFVGTLFFFLLTRDDIYDATGRWKTRLIQADRSVSHYFVTITAINAGLGVATFAVMSAIGLPSPLLWGVAAFALNFVLYLGPISFMAALLVAGLANFDGFVAFVPMLCFVGLNMIEAQFATPTLVGKRLSLNPLGVFLSIVSGLWLWGPVGGVLALPVMVWGLTLMTAPRDDITDRTPVSPVPDPAPRPDAEPRPAE
ncbi:MAG: AI-2E family transporter [Shimia sp.]